MMLLQSYELTYEVDIVEDLLNAALLVGIAAELAGPLDGAAAFDDAAGDLLTVTKLGVWLAVRTGAEAPMRYGSAPVMLPQL